MNNETRPDPKKMAILIMDYQNKQIQDQAEEKREILISNAKNILSFARSKNIPVIFIEVRSRQGPPEFKPWDTEKRKASGREDLGNRDKLFEIHPEVQPLPDETVLTKRRIGPFSTTDLFDILVRLNVEYLVLLGISTGGVVLSVVRWAADIDFKLIVLTDACSDADDEVHRVLIEKVIPRQAEVITCKEFLEAFKH